MQKQSQYKKSYQTQEDSKGLIELSEQEEYEIVGGLSILEQEELQIQEIIHYASLQEQQAVIGGLYTRLVR